MSRSAASVGGGASAGLAADQLEQLRGLLAHQGGITAALDVEPDQRLGVRRAEIETPRIELEAYPVGQVLAARRWGGSGEYPLDASPRRRVRDG